MLQTKIDHMRRWNPEKIFVLFAAILLIGIFCFYLYRASLLEKNGVYVIGKVTDIENVENGYNVSISYFFNSKKYKYVYKMLPATKDTHVFLLIAKDSPKICSLITKSHVPSCLIHGRYFDSSWNYIPTCQ